MMKYTTYTIFLLDHNVIIFFNAKLFFYQKEIFALMMILGLVKELVVMQPQKQKFQIPSTFELLPN